MSEKIIRDPVHDVIVLRTDRPLEALLFRLLNAPQVQRLRRVRQLGLDVVQTPTHEVLCGRYRAVPGHPGEEDRGQRPALLARGSPQRQR